MFFPKCWNIFFAIAHFFTRGDIKSLQDILVRVKMRKRLKLVWVHPGPLIQFTLRRLLLLCVSTSLQYWKTSGPASKNVSSFVLKILLMHSNVFAVLKNVGCLSLKWLATTWCRRFLFNMRFWPKTVAVILVDHFSTWRYPGKVPWDQCFHELGGPFDF